MDAIGYQCLIDLAEIAIGAAVIPKATSRNIRRQMWMPVSGRPGEFIGIG
jgi:hypothetical protein